VCYLAAALLFLATTWRAQAVVASTLLVTYWIVMTLVPVPGHGAGKLNPEGNLAAYLDRALLGPHVWRATRVFDPEGVLSTAPALVLIRIGPHGGSLQTNMFERVFAPWATPVNASPAYAIAYVFLWWLAMWVLDRRGIHIRV